MPKLLEIAGAIKGTLNGDAKLEIAGLAPYDNATPGSLTVAYDAKALAIVEAGLAEKVLPLQDISKQIVSHV